MVVYSQMLHSEAAAETAQATVHLINPNVVTAVEPAVVTDDLIGAPKSVDRVLQDRFTAIAGADTDKVIFNDEYFGKTPMYVDRDRATLDGQQRFHSIGQMAGRLGVRAEH